GCGWSAQRMPPYGGLANQRDFDGSPMPTDCMADETALGQSLAAASKRVIRAPGADHLRGRSAITMNHPPNAMTTHINANATLFTADPGSWLAKRGINTHPPPFQRPGSSKVHQFPVCTSNVHQFPV